LHQQGQARRVKICLEDINAVYEIELEQLILHIIKFSFPNFIVDVYILASAYMPFVKIIFILIITFWVAFIIVSGLLYYANHYLPHGPSYLTGEIICQNDDRGSCGEAYKEDLRGLNILNWAKFFKQSGGKLLWIGLLFVGVVISSAKGKFEEIKK